MNNRSRTRSRVHSLAFEEYNIDALRQGRKRMHRFVIDPQPPDNIVGVGGVSGVGDVTSELDSWSWLEGDPVNIEEWRHFRDFKTGYRLNDRIWIKEAWSCAPYLDPVENDAATWSPGQPTAFHVAYAAGGGMSIAPDGARTYRVVPDQVATLGKRRSLLFMPSHFSRWTLSVRHIAVERLQSINEIEAQWQGVQKSDVPPNTPDGNVWPTYHDAFRFWWSSLWAANPWVVVIGFDPVQTNILDLGK